MATRNKYTFDEVIEKLGDFDSFFELEIVQNENLLDFLEPLIVEIINLKVKVDFLSDQLYEKIQKNNEFLGD